MVNWIPYVITKKDMRLQFSSDMQYENWIAGLLRAKKILKTLERNDVNRRSQPEEEAETPGLSEELRELNPDLLTPMQALAILSEWKEKFK